MSEHSRGPWKIGSASGIKDAQGNWAVPPCYSIYANDDTATHGPSSVATSHLENARLIAAAPELLAALEALVEAYYDPLKHVPLLDEAALIIAKARGAV